MSIQIKHPGLLHSKLHVPQGQKISDKELSAARESKSPALRKEAQFAINAKHFHHGSNSQATAHHAAVQAMIKQHGK